MKIHRAKTPYFLELPKEFLDFLQNEYGALDDVFPFLTELAHYEYAELELRVSTEENDTADVDPNGDLLAATPVKSVLSWVFAYHYPVHRISKDYLPTEPSEQPAYLAIYRRALLDAVENNEANLSGEKLLRELAIKIHYPDIDALIKHGIDALEEMRQLEILTGTRSAE